MKVLLTLHVLAAIGLIGPLLAAGSNGIRAAKSGDAGALALISRMVTIYGRASLVVPLLGMSMVRGEDSARGHSFGDAWIIASLVLFAVAFFLVNGLLAPTLRRAVRLAESGEPSAPLAGQIAAVSGVSSILYVIIVVLMFYGP